MDETRQRLTDAEQAARRLQLQRTLALLEHASACNAPTCNSSGCVKVKSLFQREAALAGEGPRCWHSLIGLGRMVACMQSHAAEA